MKKAIVTAMVVFIALELIVLLGIPKLRSFNSSAAIASPALVPMAAPRPAHCPNIDDAINTLKAAQSDLREADHDFCGHKRAAMEATDRAVSELQAAQSCANCGN